MFSKSALNFLAASLEAQTLGGTVQAPYDAEFAPPSRHVLPARTRLGGVKTQPHFMLLIASCAL